MDERAKLIVLVQAATAVGVVQYRDEPGPLPIAAAPPGDGTRVE